MPPVVQGKSREVDGQLQLSFLDLIEVRLIDKFLQIGVGWRELRRAAVVGSKLLETEHPFASFRFRTDGRRMFADIEFGSSDKRLVALRDRQHVFREIVEPALSGVDFDAKQATRWWPLGQRRKIVIDPKICFGKPIGSESGIPAIILSQYALAHGARAAAGWYGVDEVEVRDAVLFSKRFAA